MDGGQRLPGSHIVVPSRSGSSSESLSSMSESSDSRKWRSMPRRVFHRSVQTSSHPITSMGRQMGRHEAEARGSFRCGAIVQLFWQQMVYNERARPSAAITYRPGKVNQDTTPARDKEKLLDKPAPPAKS